MITQSERSYLLAWAREVGKDHPFWDFHIHPFDALTGDVNYHLDDSVNGLFAKGSGRYHAPTPEFVAGSSDIDDSLQRSSYSERAVLLASRFTYLHTGPKVFTDQLDVAGISRAVLLPVVREAGFAVTMLNTMGMMFSADNRFILGCPFPVGISCDKLLTYFCWARDTWNVRVIKLHPNLIDLNPSEQCGRDILDATLDASVVLKLPIIVHGGKTPGLEHVEKREHSILSHLAEVNWGISSTPIIIAHAGCYGLDEDEIPSALKLLNNLLEKYSNIMVDTSYLELPVLQKVLASVDCNRLIFGSDALYVPVWKAWVRFLKALRLVSSHPDEDLIRIASLNPMSCLALSAAH